MLDHIGKGARTQKKVIAQQLADVYPNAVTKIKGEVPDIYQQARIEDAWVLLDTDLKVGDQIKVITPNAPLFCEVTAIRPGAFKVKENLGSRTSICLW